jgi:hypothetical protein
MVFHLQIVAFVLEAFFSEMEISASEKASEDDGGSSDSDNEVSSANAHLVTMTLYYIHSYQLTVCKKTKKFKTW